VVFGIYSNSPPAID